MEVAILLRESAVAKSTPGAMGNRETRSGEFCRGMTLFMSFFHVAHALFMDTDCAGHSGIVTGMMLALILMINKQHNTGYL
ncbi:hypothetical protein H6S20_29535 (plasmid) [Escherichia coli]|nr:hypothetical protein H6S20_29535 [Escherichia coli]